MKRSDIASIALIALVSMVLAYAVTTAVVSQLEGKQSARVPIVEPISSTVDQPDQAVFNKDAINPTVEVLIGGQDQEEARR